MPYRDPPPRPKLEDRLLAFRARRKIDLRFRIWASLANAFAVMALISAALMWTLIQPGCPECDHCWDFENMLLPAPWVILGLPTAIVAWIYRPRWRKAPRFALLALSLVVALCVTLALRS